VALGAVLAAAALVLLVSLGSAPLERAEIYFVDVARAMVESGDYLVPR
jgi:4-amino-4-deoxy-L-arabinose transferase-like glycosyltransferase